MPNSLSAAERQTLKGRAHRLDPVVIVGAEGLTPSVLAEIDRALKAHELIKIRVMAEGNTRERFLGEICAATDAAPVQHIGKILVVYRERPPEAAAPAAVQRRPERRRQQRRPPERPARAAPRRAKLHSR